MYRKFLWTRDLSSLKRDFQRLFGLSFVDFYDGFMSWTSQAYKIDIFRFDEALHSRFGEYENRGLSMRDLVLKEYGREALDCLEGLL